MALTKIEAAIRAFIEAKPWEKVNSGGTLVLGVEDVKGVVSYAVVTGREDGHSLALCRSAQALTAYAALLNAKKRGADEMEQVSLQLDQDYLEFRMEAPDDRILNKWLQAFGVEIVSWPENLEVLRRHEPGMLPAIMTEEDNALLSPALLAAADYAKNAGEKITSPSQPAESGKIPCARAREDGSFAWRMMDIPKDMAVEFPSPCLEDELAARRLRRIPVSGAEVKCAVRMLPMPLDEETTRVPAVMLLLDDRMGVAAAPVVENYQEDYSALAAEYLAYVEENGRPKRILAADMRAYCLLNELARQMSTPIQQAGSMPEIDDAMRSFLEYLKNTAEAQAEEEAALVEMEEVQTEKPGMGGCLADGHEADCGQMQDYLMKKMEGSDLPEDMKEENFLIRATWPEDPAFWLYAAVKTDASLRQLDQFLRDAWVECCGHMSRFAIGGQSYSSNCRELPGKSMNAKLRDVLETGAPFDYEYDMGSTTALKLEAVGRIQMVTRRQKAILVAQNFMPKYRCVRCGKRAEWVFRPGMEPIAERVFCGKCAREDENADCMLPLLNSPRTGVCGYGLWLDDEDDQ